MSIELKNETDHVFIDIGSEEWREYRFPDGGVFRVEADWLSVSASGGHRLLDRSGVSHYVTPGWLTLTWKAREGHPHFVK